MPVYVIIRNLNKLFTEAQSADCKFVIYFHSKIIYKGSIGNAHSTDLHRFILLEKLFKCNPKLKLEYVKFMNEYSELGSYLIHQMEVICRR